MSIRTTFCLPLLGLSLLAFPAGCAEEEPTELEQGLNLLDVEEPSWGIAAAYVKGEQVVYLETRVGAPKPAVYRETWPDDPPNEMDMRFLDRDGKMFYAIRGGDTFIDPSWNQDLGASLSSATPVAERSQSFRLAREAAEAFLAEAPEGTEDHAHHLANFAAMTPPSDDPEMIAREQRLRTAVPTPPAAPTYADWSRGGWFLLDGQLFADSCCGGVGMHSAVRLWYLDSGASWQVSIDACNHGRCPWEMNYRGENWGDWVSYAYISAEHLRNNTSVGGGCRSPYDWWSGSPWGNGNDHLCNSDSAYELWQVRRASTWVCNGNGCGDGRNSSEYSFRWYGGCNGGDCGDNSNAYYSCTCRDSFGDCDNDYGYPDIPW